jgi:hypothetical protein
LRAFGVTLGPALLLDLYAGASTVALVRRIRARRPPAGPARLVRPLLALGAAAPWVYLLAIRPWLLGWGATDVERRKPLLGDEQAPDGAQGATRAITIDAPIEDVWRWLAQIGQDRGGFYSYEWLENLAGCQLHNADRIHPEWQQRAVGEVVQLHPRAGLKVTLFEPNRALGLDGWGTFVLEPIDARRTRLIARDHAPRGWSGRLGSLLWEIPHSIMQRKMLLGIKERAERARAA